MSGDDAAGRIRRLLVTAANRLKQRVGLDRVFETYEEALELAREAGLEDSLRPLVEVRPADLASIRRACDAHGEIGCTDTPQEGAT
jgi:hypothetical protein